MESEMLYFGSKWNICLNNMINDIVRLTVACDSFNLLISWLTFKRQIMWNTVIFHR